MGEVVMPVEPLGCRKCGRWTLVNLDAMDINELTAAAAALTDLAEYARTKRLAIVYRDDGNIRKARHHENRCEAIYKRLPEWVKW